MGAENAQELIKDAAIVDRKLKEDISHQTLEEGNIRKSAALGKRIASVSNANAAYASETAAYAKSLKSQGELLDYELQVVAQMRKAMNGEEFGAAPEMKTFDHCTNEKTAADDAATECNAAKNACANSKIDALDDKSTETGRRLLASHGLGAMFVERDDPSIETYKAATPTERCESDLTEDECLVYRNANPGPGRITAFKGSFGSLMSGCQLYMDPKSPAYSRVVYNAFTGNEDLNNEVGKTNRVCSAGWCVRSYSLRICKRSKKYDNAQRAGYVAGSPCDQETTSCDAKDSVRATYESCLGQAQLLSTEELKAAFVQLHSKYASETDMSDTFSEHKDEMEGILLAVEAKIGQERSAAKDQHDADVASSLAKQTQDVAGCIAAEKAVIDKWDSKIAVAKAAWDAAAVVQATEVAEYVRLVRIRIHMQVLYDAAASRQQTEGSLARKLHKQDVDGAWEYYTDMHQGITSVATSDYEYLTEELESLQTVLDIVDQLNLDGDTNGEHVAAEHVTNDYATDAADAKAAYHGATINESNSEGRAGEGHAEEHAH